MAATKGFTNHLSLAACEWLLMFLMFIDAALAYFLTKFAQYCELQVPCLFCLRLDHLFGNEEPGSYLSLFCTKHRADVSYLISCNLHNKLADVREMCDDCFMSLMVGPIGKEGYQKSYLNKNFVRVPSTMGACPCCKRQWKAKSNAQRLIKPNIVGLGASTATVKPPLPRVSGRSRFSRRDSFKRVRDKISGTMGVDTLSHVGYSELRITSDSESEVPFSDDDDASVVSRGTSRSNQEKVFVRQSHSASDPGFLENVHLEESIASRSTSLASNGSIGHDLGELNGPKMQSRSSPHPPSELTPENGDVELPLGASADKFSAGHVSSVPRDTDTSADQRTLSTNGGESDSPKTEKDIKLPSIISTQEMDSSSHIRSDLSSTSLDKSDGYEYLDGSSVGEIEGEGVVEKLKRQVEYDRKSMKLLQSELEEERNAAAIAANQAMAMITRLQEEKASLHMEALQYLRMMEEQAEYDMEALQKANDLVDEKDKEIQDLEDELESYRNELDEVENLKNGKIDPESSFYSKPIVVNAPILDIEDEKRYILQCLSELERKFHHFSSPQTSMGMSNGDIYTERTTNKVEKTEDFQDHLKDESLSRNKDSSKSHENENHVDYRKKRIYIDGGEVDLATLENEISDLNERLEALEADRDFLEHACNALHNSGGLQFIQEIARQLQALRRIRFGRKGVSIT